MSKYFTIDEKTGDIKMQSINIDSISEIFKNEKYSNFIDAIFDGDVNMFKDFV